MILNIHISSFRLYEKSSMPNSAAAAYTAAVQEPANACSKELPAALRYLADYYLRFSLLDHASHYAYKCLEHESVSFLWLSFSSSV